MTKDLFECVDELRNSEVKDSVDDRLREFKSIGEGSSDELFKELCFCILTANFNAERSMEIQRKMGDQLLTLPKSRLSMKLRQLGHRYPNARAAYIVNAREHRRSIKEIIEGFNDEHRLREWLVKNVKGIGYKEASHFLRNIGYDDFAIIDFHVMDVLTKYQLIEKPKALTKNRYIQIEGLLKKIADALDLKLAELDLYLWYMETGKILK